jgi:phage terminase large subunit-like protein
MNKKILDVVEWAESSAGFYVPDTRAPIVLADHQKLILRHILAVDNTGRLPYDTVVYSCPKKSGKTTLAALVAEYFALFVEPPNEIFMLANSLEQSQGRAYKMLKLSVEHNPYLSKRTDTQAKVICFSNGTDVIPLTSDYATAAGSNHGLTIWDELWAYQTENSQRLWDEMTPVPTKKISMRFVVTYAGFTGESKLLEELYSTVMSGEPVPELEHIQNGEGKPACTRDGRTFVYWDHELKAHPGLTLSPDEYHQEQRRTLRPLSYVRMHENKFTTNESRFITPEQWEACYDPNLTALTNYDQRSAIFGADASTSRDLTALVGVSDDNELGISEVVYSHVWRPMKSEYRGGKPTVDLDRTIGDKVIELYHSGGLSGVYADPYQLHSQILRWEDEGIKVVEMPQTGARTEADQALYDAITGKTIRHYNDPDLNEHMRNAVAAETPRGFRLAKEKTRLKIDLAVALSMALYGARNQGATWLIS